jgi:hypothetical protein
MKVTTTQCAIISQYYHGTTQGQEEFLNLSDIPELPARFNAHTYKPLS